MSDSVRKDFDTAINPSESKVGTVEETPSTLNKYMNELRFYPYPQQSRTSKILCLKHWYGKKDNCKDCQREIASNLKANPNYYK